MRLLISVTLAAFISPTTLAFPFPMSSRSSSTTPPPPRRPAAPVKKRIYSVSNAETIRRCVMKSVREMLNSEEDVHLSIDIGFHRGDYANISDGTAKISMTKGEPAFFEEQNESDGEDNEAHEEELDQEDQEKKKAFQMQKATKRAVPTGEFYAVKWWWADEQDEPAIREQGEEREDATANDTHSLESVSSNKTAEDKRTPPVHVAMPESQIVRGGENELKVENTQKSLLDSEVKEVIQKPRPPPVVGGSVELQKDAKGKTEVLLSVYCPKENDS